MSLKTYFVIWSYSTQFEHVSTEAPKAPEHVCAQGRWARKHARHVGTWAHMHARHVGTWVHMHASHVGTWARKAPNLADFLYMSPCLANVILFFYFWLCNVMYTNTYTEKKFQSLTLQGLNFCEVWWGLNVLIFIISLT